VRENRTHGSIGGRWRQRRERRDRRETHGPAPGTVRTATKPAAYLTGGRPRLPDVDRGHPPTTFCAASTTASRRRAALRRRESVIGSTLDVGAEPSDSSCAESAIGAAPVLLVCLRPFVHVVRYLCVRCIKALQAIGSRCGTARERGLPNAHPMNSVYAVVEVVIAAHREPVLEAAHARQRWLALLAVRWPAPTDLTASVPHARLWNQPACQRVHADRQRGVGRRPSSGSSDALIDQRRGIVRF
jgi:hypothetical protein